MPPIQLSVVIVGYKNDQIVVDCINSIYKYNDIGSRLQVILVDNSPTHNVYETIVKKFDLVIGIKNENNGFGGGNNRGAAEASGGYLLFLNPDTVLIEPIFQFALSKFEGDPNLGMFGMKLVNESTKRNMSFYFLEGSGLVSSLIIKICNRLDIYLDGLMYISGANMFIRKADFLLCGEFDENIFMYYEEPDLTRRLTSLGRNTAYFKQKKIIHLEGGTVSDSEVALRRRLDSAVYYNKKYSKNLQDQLVGELRINYLKLLLNKLTRSSHISQTRLTISVLREYIYSSNSNVE
jgi:GT2 family glycosyltransferase